MVEDDNDNWDDNDNSDDNDNDNWDDNDNSDDNDNWYYNDMIIIMGLRVTYKAETLHKRDSVVHLHAPSTNHYIYLYD